MMWLNRRYSVAGWNPGDNNSNPDISPFSSISPSSAGQNLYFYAFFIKAYICRKLNITQ
jgi:hypothetical protein